MGTGVNNAPQTNRETSKFARINFTKRLILLAQKDYEFKPPSTIRNLISDFGIKLTFDQLEDIYSLVDTKQAKLSILSNDGTSVENDI